MKLTACLTALPNKNIHGLVILIHQVVKTIQNPNINMRG